MTVDGFVKYGEPSVCSPLLNKTSIFDKYNSALMSWKGYCTAT